MLVNNIQTSNNSYYRPQYRRPEVTFAGYNINASSEKSMHGIEYSLRIVGNKLADLFSSKKSKFITKCISLVKPEQNKKYLDILEEISNYYSSTKQIGINLEDKVLEKVVNKDKPVIFIMTHSNQSEDPSMLAVLNTLLTKAYKQAGKENSFPLPKIILNQDILTTMNPTKRKAFEAFGAVGIDANIFNADKATNARAFLPLIKDFIKGKCNIFIFPEGKLAVKKYLPLHERFQSGVAEIINKVLGIKKEVDVVPVGFAYGKDKDKIYTGMHIGKPVTFKRIGEDTTITAGEIQGSEFADKTAVDFFEKHKDKQDVVLTSNGIPIKPNNVSDCIKELLSENLLVCSKKAEINVLNPANKEEVIVIK